ncbi:hypothetical protein GQ53DRAFT_755159 [Thozetella sp. PMI_491]|nr:hypothetical protein GQ53DRAFT_755159 [Thozetella sp. PMI_491]
MLLHCLRTPDPWITPALVAVNLVAFGTTIDLAALAGHSLPLSRVCFPLLESHTNPLSSLPSVYTGVVLVL